MGVNQPTAWLKENGIEVSGTTIGDGACGDEVSICFDDGIASADHKVWASEYEDELNTLKAIRNALLNGESMQDVARAAGFLKVRTFDSYYDRAAYIARLMGRSGDEFVIGNVNSQLATFRKEWHHRIITEGPTMVIWIEQGQDDEQPKVCVGQPNSAFPDFHLEVEK